MVLSKTYDVKDLGSALFGFGFKIQYDWTCELLSYLNLYIWNMCLKSSTSKLQDNDMSIVKEDKSSIK